ncbi:hypothetical protein Q1695_001174 [Nippostrongylus brasiliensis]|nr:hypothetical protein Q1695_001174 [Nippostrongylus brasiliensis]
MYATPDNMKNITLAIMILHNLLVDDIGGEAAADRFGIEDAFEHQEGVGVVGNVSTEAKMVREAMKAYFCRRDNVRPLICIYSVGARGVQR